jgi:hypothetical protein
LRFLSLILGQWSGVGSLGLRSGVRRLGLGSVVFDLRLGSVVFDLRLGSVVLDLRLGSNILLLLLGNRLEIGFVSSTASGLHHWLGIAGKFGFRVAGHLEEIGWD